MLSIVFETIKENPGDETAITIMQKCCDKIVEKNNGRNIDTQEICDDVCNTMDYYNDFVKEKKLTLPIIGNHYYNMVVIVLNAIIGEIK